MTGNFADMSLSQILQKSGADIIIDNVCELPETLTNLPEAIKE